MDSEVMKQHIGLYVNQYSLSLGDAGRKALRILLQEGAGEITEPLFIK
jgi:predicted solute-binding protein